MCVRICIKPAMTCIGNVRISIAFCLLYPHTWFLSFQTWTVHLSHPLHSQSRVSWAKGKVWPYLSFQTWIVLLSHPLHPQSRVSWAKGKVWRVHMCVRMYMYIKPAMTCIGNVTISIAFCPYYQSTHMVSELPNLNSSFVSPSTFTIQSFISCRQGMESSHVCESVHKASHDLYR